MDGLRSNRLEKMNRIIENGDNPYKYKYRRTHTIIDVKSIYNKVNENLIENIEVENVSLCGRIMSKRIHGDSSFFDIKDESAKIQIFFGLDRIGDSPYRNLDNLDIGDIIGVKGNVKKSKRGEITIYATEYTILTKSLHPIGEKYHGISDTETRYRTRELDLISNENTMNIFKTRSLLISNIRRYLENMGFTEVETPMFHPIPGGATARPFITHHNTYDTDLYLRIAPELYLKRLIVGGFEKVFEINRCFRNEGIDTRHNPEFTTLELYEAYKDYDDLMDDTADLLGSIIRNIFGTTFEYQGNKILANPGNFTRITLHDAIREYAKINLENNTDRENAAKLAQSIGIKVDPSMGYGKIVDAVMSKAVQPHLVQPTFLYDYPIEISPLAKKKRGNPALTERFQVFIGGLEIGNAFSELNDPIDQRNRFEEQLKLRDLGDDEAQYLDEEFIKALEIGMPPAAGLGIGIDRLTMLLTDNSSIREVILFPLLRNI